MSDYFSHFYPEYVCRHMRHLFPVLSSYSRFVELEKEVALYLDQNGKTTMGWF